MLRLTEVVAGYGPMQVLRNISLDVSGGDRVPARRQRRG